MTTVNGYPTFSPSAPSEPVVNLGGDEAPKGPRYLPNAYNPLTGDTVIKTTFQTVEPVDTEASIPKERRMSLWERISSTLGFFITALTLFMVIITLIFGQDMQNTINMNSDITILNREASDRAARSITRTSNVLNDTWKKLVTTSTGVSMLQTSVLTQTNVMKAYVDNSFANLLYGQFGSILGGYTQSQVYIEHAVLNTLIYNENDGYIEDTTFNKVNTFVQSLYYPYNPAITQNAPVIQIFKYIYYEGVGINTVFGQCNYTMPTPNVDQQVNGISKQYIPKSAVFLDVIAPYKPCLTTSYNRTDVMKKNYIIYMQVLINGVVTQSTPVLTESGISTSLTYTQGLLHHVINQRFTVNENPFRAYYVTNADMQAGSFFNLGKVYGFGVYKVSTRITGYKTGQVPDPYNDYYTTNYVSVHENNAYGVTIPFTDIQRFNIINSTMASDTKQSEVVMSISYISGDPALHTVGSLVQSGDVKRYFGAGSSVQEYLLRPNDYLFGDILRNAARGLNLLFTDILFANKLTRNLFIADFTSYGSSNYDSSSILFVYPDAEVLDKYIAITVRKNTLSIVQSKTALDRYGQHTTNPFSDYYNTDIFSYVRSDECILAFVRTASPYVNPLVSKTPVAWRVRLPITIAPEFKFSNCGVNYDYAVCTNTSDYVSFEEQDNRATAGALGDINRRKSLFLFQFLDNPDTGTANLQSIPTYSYYLYGYYGTSDNSFGWAEVSYVNNYPIKTLTVGGVTYTQQNGHPRAISAYLPSTYSPQFRPSGAGGAVGTYIFSNLLVYDLTGKPLPTPAKPLYLSNADPNGAAFISFDEVPSSTTAKIYPMLRFS